MGNRSPTSSMPTLTVLGRGRWLRAGRLGLALLVVATVGALLVAARSNLLAADQETSAKQNHTALSRLIDLQIGKRMKADEVAASERCSDAEFVRRAYLDIAGVIPPVEKVREFLASNAGDKRAKLVDELLENPRYGKFFAEIWSNDLVPKISNNRRLNSKPLESWLAGKLNANTPWDKLVYEVITASGPQDKNGAVTFYVGNFGPDQVTNKITKHFLGVQLQCAQCHNHPFTDWKQDEYWGMAAFFQKVGLNVNPNQAAKQGIQPAIKEYDLQSLRGGRGKARKRTRVRLFRIPNDGKRLPPSFLLDKQNPGLEKSEPYRPVLAKWITSKKNRFFARAISNKLWGHFFGRGLVNPVNDMHDDNPSTHPDLLQQLAEQMKANDFDLKYMIRAICSSETYQRSSRPKGNNGDDKELFSRALVRQLSPEQLYDSLESILKTSRNAPQNKRRRKVPFNRRGGNGPRDQFITFFSGDDGYKPLEYQTGIPQALRLMNSPQTNRIQTINTIAKSGMAPAAVIEELYLTALSRRPTQAESQRLAEYIRGQDNPRTAYGDILWALLNSSEFALNH